jgi:hypothetical protein
LNTVNLDGHERKKLANKSTNLETHRNVLISQGRSMYDMLETTDLDAQEEHADLEGRLEYLNIFMQRAT